MRFFRFWSRWVGPGHTIMAAGLLGVALTSFASASTPRPGDAFKHVYHATPHCGPITSGVAWRGLVARQHAQHCTFVARYTVKRPVTPVPTTVPTVVPTRVPTPIPTRVPPTVEPTQTWSTPTPTPSNPITLELQLLNATRTQYGVPPLAIDVTENGCAAQHSEHMEAEGYLSHDQFPADICVPYSTAGENVGMSSTGSWQTDLQQLHTLMMSEPHDATTCARLQASGSSNHACNILNPNFHRVGVGVAGSTWLTTDFVG